MDLTWFCVQAWRSAAAAAAATGCSSPAGKKTEDPELKDSFKRLVVSWTKSLFKFNEDSWYKEEAFWCASGLIWKCCLSTIGQTDIEWVTGEI